jgi:hypothetical protein
MDGGFCPVKNWELNPKSQLYVGKYPELKLVNVTGKGPQPIWGVKPNVSTGIVTMVMVSKSESMQPVVVYSINSTIKVPVLA